MMVVFSLKSPLLTENVYFLVLIMDMRQARAEVVSTGDQQMCHSSAGVNNHL